MRRRVPFGLCVLFVLNVGFTATKAKAAGITVTPKKIIAGLFYGGRKITVKTEAPRGSDVVIKVTGHNEHLELNKKGKTAGLLWMTVGEVEFASVPSLYLLASSRRLNEIASSSLLERYFLGYQSLAKGTANRPNSEQSRAFFEELVKLKRYDRLFGVDESGVRLRPQSGDYEAATADVLFPPKAAIGDYQIEAIAFKDGKATLLGSVTIKLEQSEFIHSISELAEKHGLAYGLFSVIAAILAGLAAGFLFGAGKGKAH